MNVNRGFNRCIVMTLLGVGLCTATLARADDTVTLAALAPSALLWTHAIANAEGFYAHHHITVRELRVGSSPALVQAVATGSADAGAALGDNTVSAIDKGAPIRIVGSMIGKSVLRLVVAKNVPNIQALEGQNVTAGAVKGGTANLLRLQLSSHGVNADSVHMLSLTNSKDRVVALANGQVKGALLIAPFDTMAQREGMKVMDVYQPPYIETALIVNQHWAHDHQADAIALTQALKQAADWLNDPANRAQAIAILAKYTNTPADVCAESYAFIVQEQKAISPGLSVDPEGVHNLLRLSDEVGASANAQNAPFDLSKYYDPTFLAGH